jgi:hypothetical protein
MARTRAARFGVDESAVLHYVNGSASLLERWHIDRRRLFHYAAEEILRLAQHGNVLIKGWGVATLLRDLPGVISVRVCAPMEFRVRVLAMLFATISDWMISSPSRAAKPAATSKPNDPISLVIAMTITAASGTFLLIAKFSSCPRRWLHMPVLEGTPRGNVPGSARSPTWLSVGAGVGVLVAVALKIGTNSGVRIGQDDVTTGHGVGGVDVGGSGFLGLRNCGGSEDRGNGQSSNQGLHDDLLRGWSASLR